MDVKATWDNEDWMLNAKHILHWSASVEQDKPMMLLVRHSHREILRDHTEMVSAGLTHLGKELAIEVGKRIPAGRPMHLFTSFIPRCFETAEGIAEGFSEMGGEVIDIDPLPTLVGPHVLEQDVWKELHPNGENVTEFVNRWVGGEFDGRMEPFEDYEVRLTDDTVKRLTAVQENIIHVHVTHDLALMSAKRMILGRVLTRDDREPYLGGLGATIVDSGLQLFIASMNSTISICDSMDSSTKKSNNS